MGEAAHLNAGERLIRWDWRDVVTHVAAFLARLPDVIVQGWRADAQRRALFVPVLMGAGIGIYFALPSEPPLWLAPLATIPAIIWFALSRTTSWAAAIAVSASLAAVCAGLGIAIVRAHMLDATPLTREVRLTITGRIAALEPAERKRTRLWLDVHATKPQLAEQPERVRISISKAPADLLPGQWIDVRGTLRPLPAPVAPGSFDFGRKLWFDGIGAVGFSLSPVERIDAPRPDTAREAASGWIQAVRHSVSERIRGAMSPRAGPIAAALLTGERGLISEEDNEAMRDSSLAHLLSISGLHMALAGFGFFIALRLIFALIPPVVLNYPVKKWAAAAALLASFAYLLLSGASVPTQRSFVMIAVALIAIIFDRSALNMRVVAIAAVIVLALTPESWIDPSFQMSFAAVVALVAVYEWWNARRLPDAERKGILMRSVGMIAAAAATSLIAGLATAPFAAFHFNRFADYGVAANVMVMPIVSFVIMPAGVLALVLMPFGLEWLPLMAMEEGIDAMLVIAHWVASWPGSTQAVRAWPVAALAFIAAGGFWIALWLSAWRWLGVVPVIIGLTLPLFVKAPDVIVSADADNVAVRDQNGDLHLLSSRRGRFDAEIWLRRDGDAREIADLPQDDGRAFSCDSAGCIARIRGRADKLIAVTHATEGMVEDCKHATVVIDTARGWRHACDEPQLVVTAKTLRKEGAIAAQLDGDGIAWTSVNRERGNRPWTGRPSQ